MTMEQRRDDNPYNFSKREIEIMILQKEGLRSEQIAQKLSMSPKTLEIHLQSIYKKIIENRK